MCILFVYTSLQVGSLFDLCVLSMSVTGFQTSFNRGVGVVTVVSSARFNFAKRLIVMSFLFREKPLETEVEDQTTALTYRKNVYDDDEFDVFHRDNVDTSKIHRGKK